jgi:hypothetical protein
VLANSHYSKTYKEHTSRILSHSFQGPCSAGICRPPTGSQTNQGVVTFQTPTEAGVYPAASGLVKASPARMCPSVNSKPCGGGGAQCGNQKAESTKFGDVCTPKKTKPATERSSIKHSFLIFVCVFSWSSCCFLYCMVSLSLRLFCFPFSPSSTMCTAAGRAKPRQLPVV